MPVISISEILSKYIDSEKILTLDFYDAESFKKILRSQYPKLYDVLFDQNQCLNGYVMVCKNHQQIFLDQDEFQENDQIQIIVPASGG